ncbi:MAG: rod shape-determining protein MreC [candidate division Zixibacteria bacterium]|nr:rod shape-determining protein MreC [candidate division Zixibacteria bacterium]
MSAALLILGEGVRESLSGLAVDYIYGPFLAMKHRVTSGATVFEENRALQQRIADLSMENQHLREQSQENERLRKLLEFSQAWMARAIPAEVVGPISSTSAVMWIDAGRWRNVQIGWPVATEDGLVGRIIEVGDKLSRVRTIWDRLSRTAVYDSRSRVAGILAWESGPNLELTYVLPSADIIEGDTLISSGWGGVFPKGLQVGVVAAIDTTMSDAFLGVQVAPFARADHLEHVFVLRADQDVPPLPVPEVAPADSLSPDSLSQENPQ